MSDYSRIYLFLKESLWWDTQEYLAKNIKVFASRYKKSIFLSLAELQLLDLTFASTTVSAHVPFPLTPSPKSGCSWRQNSQMLKVWRFLGMGSAAIRAPSRVSVHVLCVWRAYFLLSLLNLS